MKTVTIDLAEEVVADLEGCAARLQRSTADVMREAIENYRIQRIVRGKGKSLRDHPVFNLGPMLRPFGPDDDLLEEMLDARV